MANLKVLSVVVLMLAGLASGARATTAVPWKYHWRDISGNCMDDCNNDTYRCPCWRWTVPMPR